jgi:small-conductance mechanosensitive channel
MAQLEEETMQQMIEWKDHVLHLHPWVLFLVETLALIAGAWVFHVVVIGRLKKWAGRTATTLDDGIVALLGSAIRPLLVLGVLAGVVNMLEPPARLLKVSNRIISLAVLIIALYYISRLCQLLLQAWINRAPERESVADPARFIVKIAFAGLAAMIVLDNLGISLTAVWTTLGVGSVAVALALQDTLSNFFSGVYLRLDRPVRVGDFVKLEDNHEGFVIAMGWRSTRIRTLPNNVVVVPNAKLASAIVTNYSLPDPPMSLLISIGVSYDCDPGRVEQVLVDEATAAAESGKIEGLLADPAPFVRFIPGFGDSSLDFTLICRVATFVDQYLVQHELRKRIFARFRNEGISIPFPQRDVHLYSHAPGTSEERDGISGRKEVAAR